MCKFSCLYHPRTVTYKINKFSSLIRWILNHVRFDEFLSKPEWSPRIILAFSVPHWPSEKFSHYFRKVKYKIDKFSSLIRWIPNHVRFNKFWSKSEWFPRLILTFPMPGWRFVQIFADIIPVKWTGRSISFCSRSSEF